MALKRRRNIVIEKIVGFFYFYFYLFFTFLIAEVAVAVTMEMRTVRFASREQSSWRSGLLF